MDFPDNKARGLLAPLAVLKAVGEKNAGRFTRLVNSPKNPARVIDLLLHAPVGAVDRVISRALSEAMLDGTATIEVVVVEHIPAPRRGGRAPAYVVCQAQDALLYLVFFNLQKERIAKSLPLGRKVVVSGELKSFNGRYQMAHPEWIVEPETARKRPRFEAEYPLTDGLTHGAVRRAVAEALERLRTLPEWHTARALQLNPLPDFAASLKALHMPRGTDVQENAPERLRLAFDELFASQIALQQVRRQFKQTSGRALAVGQSAMLARLLAALPYAPTAAQKRSFEQIKADMASEKRMLRLLQGDVGSGKTLVAAMAACPALEAGFQVAIMAPTEILAQQHLATFEALFTPLGVQVTLLTGRDKGKARKQKLTDIASGKSAIVLGTHALFQSDVVFADLALVVVDEQHRFGVEQRLALTQKGPQADILLMTATPIPRSLLLTFFGDMDVSVLDEKPAGRQPIDTRLMNMERVQEVVAGLARALSAGARAYWVCPLVAETELSDLTAAEDRAAFLRERFGGRVELVHGKMSSQAKDEALARFISGAAQILVATTVIEVGVNVPEASIMIIEQAERFGLSQLHQLRGRVGRGMEKASCLLLYRAPLGEIARQRLETIRGTEDGFRIAEDDLRLRGGGDLVGAQQSGMTHFRFANLSDHTSLAALARDEAQRLMEDDPALNSPRGQACQMLLALFGKENAAELMPAG